MAACQWLGKDAWNWPGPMLAATYSYEQKFPAEMKLTASQQHQCWCVVIAAYSWWQICAGEGCLILG